jgi:hypothetical protein
MKLHHAARSSALAAVFASSVLGAWSLGRQEAEVSTVPTVVRRFTEHAARPAQLEFDVATRTLTVVGEARRPFAFDAQTDPQRPVWWTTIGPLDGAPELRYLILEEGRRALDDPKRELTGLPERYTNDESFAVLPIRFGREAAGYVNTNAGNLDVRDPSHFRRLSSIDGQTAFLLVGTSGNLDLLIPHDSIEGKFFNGEAEGDGSDVRLGGLQIDLVFEAVLGRLPGTSLRLLGDVNNESQPIERYVRVPF